MKNYFVAKASTVSTRGTTGDVFLQDAPAITGRSAWPAASECERGVRFGTLSLCSVSEIRIAGGTVFSILLEFPCQPINHDTHHFHHGFPGVLQGIIARYEIKRFNVIPALSR